jgi:hypothetical protein
VLLLFCLDAKKKITSNKKRIKKLKQASLPYFGLEKNALRKLIG